jgi:hypothetical protein
VARHWRSRKIQLKLYGRKHQWSGCLIVAAVIIVVDDVSVLP